MKCANCNCEIGNLTQCPYCGHKNRYVYRAQETAGEYGTVGQYDRRTQPVQSAPRQQPTVRQMQYPPRGTAQAPQAAPTRTMEPPRRRQQSRDSGSIELLLRLILLMQCLIAVLIAIQLVVTSLGVHF